MIKPSAFTRVVVLTLTSALTLSGTLAQQDISGGAGSLLAGLGWGDIRVNPGGSARCRHTVPMPESDHRVRIATAELSRFTSRP